MAGRRLIACRKPRFQLLHSCSPLIIIMTSVLKAERNSGRSLRLNVLVSHFRGSFPRRRAAQECTGRPGGFDAGEPRATDPPGCHTGEELAHAQVEWSGAGRSECGCRE